MKPSIAMKRNWENVIRFPTPGSSFTSSSKKTTFEQQPIKTNAIANVGPILEEQPKNNINKLSAAELNIATFKI